MLQALCLQTPDEQFVLVSILAAMAIITCHYLSSCFRCLIPNRFVHSPLTPDTKEASSTRLLPTGYPLLSGPSPVNPRDDCDGVEIPAVHLIQRHFNPLPPAF